MNIDPACTLPSGQSACRLIRGDMTAVPLVFTHMIGRAFLISTGMYVAGFRGWDLAKASLAGAAAIEVYVLAYIAQQVHSQKATKSVKAKSVEGLRARTQRARQRIAGADCLICGGVD